MPFDSAFEDDSVSNNWFASPLAADSGTSIPPSQITAAFASQTNPFATPPTDPWPPWRHFWSMFPASAATANAGLPPSLPNGDPALSGFPASNWPAPQALSPTVATDPTPPWPPSQSLLGLIPYLPPISAPAFATQGFFSIPVLDNQFPRSPLVQDVSDTNVPASTTPSGSIANPPADADSSTSGDQTTPLYPPNAGLRPQNSEAGSFSRFLNAINPISPAYAAGDEEDEPLPPAVVEALTRALRDPEFAKRLQESQELLRRFHEAAEDLQAFRDNKSSRRALGRALEASGIERPEGYAAHHIVAGNIDDAGPARLVLRKFKININDPANGVFLPANLATENIGGEAVHSTLHTKEYVAGGQRSPRKREDKAGGDRYFARCPPRTASRRISVSMNIYKIKPAEGYEWLLPVDPDDHEQMIFDGMPRGKTWRPIQMRRLKFSRGRFLQPCDFPSAAATLHLPMTPRARQIVGPFMEKYGEFLPLKCDDGDFCTFHVTNFVDALDEHASDVLRSSDEPDVVLLINKHVFRPERLTDDWMFKLPQSRGRGGIYVTDPFVHLIHGSGLTGLDFRRVWPHS